MASEAAAMAACRLLALLVLCLRLADASRFSATKPVKYLIVSAPRFGQVSYVKIPSTVGRVETNLTGTVVPLITSGLVHPQGLAVDQRTRTLYVADPDSQAIFAYPLRAKRGVLAVGERKIAASGTEARWVSVDDKGTVFFSDELKNQVLKLAQAQALRGNTTPTIIYDGSSLAQVNAPGGVAADDFYTYWANKQIGTQVGSIVKGSVAPDVSMLQSSVTPLAKNTDKSYGVCLVSSNVYYTQPSKSIYGVKKTGSDVVAITDQLTNPRGCSWDGDGTVYVADRGANAVYSFAGNMQALSTAQLSKTVTVEDAFGVAVFSGKALRLWSFNTELLCALALIGLCVSF